MPPRAANTNIKEKKATSPTTPQGKSNKTTTTQKNPPTTKKQNKKKKTTTARSNQTTTTANKETKPKPPPTPENQVTEEEKKTAAEDFDEFWADYTSKQSFNPNNQDHVVKLTEQAIEGEFSNEKFKYLSLKYFLEKFKKQDLKLKREDIDIDDLTCLIYVHILNETDKKHLDGEGKTSLSNIETIMRTWEPELTIEEIYLYLYLSKIQNDYPNHVPNLLEKIKAHGIDEQKCIALLHMIIEVEKPPQEINEILIYHCSQF